MCTNDEVPRRLTPGWYVTEGGIERTLEILAEGLPVPQVGDRVLLFLVPEEEERIDVFDAPLTHRPVTLDGLAYMNGSTVEIVAQRFEGDLGDTLQGMGLQTIRDEIGR